MTTLTSKCIVKKSHYIHIATLWNYCGIIQFIPKVFCGAQIQWFRWPRKYRNVIVLEIGCCHPCCMWPSVVMLDQLAVILHNGNNMMLQNFITVPLSRQCTIDMHQFNLAVSDIAPHIITLPPPNLSASWMQFAAKRSFRLLYTLALPSARCSRDLDSSLNQTDLHRCWGHTLCVCAHWSLFWRCYWFKTTVLTWRLALIPASCRRFLTVCSEILSTPGIFDAVNVHLADVNFTKLRNGT
jgi:hypothetical protein